MLQNIRTGALVVPYIQGENREQLTLNPICLDDYIAPDNICRVINAFVRNLDMEGLGFVYAQTKATGRPPYDPAHMLMLYLYGYLNRIRSSRRLEAETHRNVEVMWLLEKLTPDDKTIVVSAQNGLKLHPALVLLASQKYSCERGADSIETVLFEQARKTVFN